MILIKEVWKTVDEWPYLVSSIGRIRRIGSLKIKSQHTDGAGYKLVQLSKNGKSKTFRVHVLVAKAFIGKRPKGMLVNHKDLVKSNNHERNIEYLSPKGNTAHAIAGGAFPRGEGHYISKLNERSVREIRLRYFRGESRKAMAEEFGVNTSAIHQAARGKTWRHVV